MSTDLTPLKFSNGEFDLTFHPDGAQGWHIPAAPVARALGFAAAKDMLRSLPDGVKGWEIAPTHGGDQRVWHLTLPGFFQALGQRQASRVKDPTVRSRVERFQSWNFGTVLPSIAATGSYALPAVAPTPAIPQTYADALQLAADQARQIERQAALIEAVEAKVVEMEPAARAWHGLVEDDREGISMTDASKVLRSAGAKIGDQEFPRYLAEKKMIHRAGHRGHWTANRSAEDRGYLIMKLDTGVHRGKDGKIKNNDPSARVLKRGMEHLLSMLVAERGSRTRPTAQASMELVIR